MLGWIHSLVLKTFAIVAGVLAIIGLGGSAASEPAEQSTQTQQQAASSTQEQIGALQQQLAQEKSEREKLENQIISKQQLPSTTSQLTTRPKIFTKTFTTPSGAILDENGNIISGPTKPIPATAAVSNVAPGDRVLTSEEIYALVSPSVVLISTPDNSHGSGFSVDGGRYTLTNAHVVGSYQNVQVTLSSGVSYQAVVLGTSVAQDVALIYNGDEKPPAVIFGFSNSQSLATGSDVYALGFPLEFTSTATLTKGIISANRQTTSLGSLIQTDAAINHGNSGGPLINNKGEVVGINSLGAIDPSSQTLASGIGFAIPIETAESLIPSLSDYGQSRYELYPIGSALTIKRSMLINIGYNDSLSCSQLGYTGNDLTICSLFKEHHNDYRWSIKEDI